MQLVYHVTVLVSNHFICIRPMFITTSFFGSSFWLHWFDFSDLNVSNDFHFFPGYSITFLTEKFIIISQKKAITSLSWHNYVAKAIITNVETKLTLIFHYKRPILLIRFLIRRHHIKLPYITFKILVVWLSNFLC